MKQIDFKNELGKSLKELRKNKNLTLRYVEEQTGISNSYLSQLENGKIANPSIFVIYKLSTIYGVSLDDLMSSVISGEGQTENKSNIKHIIEQLKK